VRAVWLLAGFETRRRWRALVALSLLVGLIGVVALAAVAGARRSSTALTRFADVSRSADVELIVGHPTAAQLDAFRRTPHVAATAVLRAYALIPRGTTRSLAVGAALDSSMGHSVDRARVLAGRLANPAAANEIDLDEHRASMLHLRVGGTLDASSYGARQFDSGHDPGPAAGPIVHLKVVGIVRRPLDLGDRAASGGVLILTPAFDRVYSNRIASFTDVLRVRTRDGAGDVPRVTTAARRIFGKSPDFDVQSLEIETKGAGDAIRVLTLALWLFAAVAAVAGFVTIAIVLTREISRENNDQDILRGLGLTRRQRIAVHAPPAALVAAGGATLSAVGAIAVSPFFPLGVAGKAEPDPGFHVDTSALALGVFVVVAVVLLVALLAAIRITRRPSAPRPRPRRRSAGEVAAGAGSPPTVSIGLEMALRSDGGTRSVPVRSAFVGAVFGVLGVTAVVVFAASVQHLTSTPQLYGWTWDIAAIDQHATVACNGHDVGLGAVGGIAAVAEVCYEHLEVDDRPTAGWSIASLRGAIEPAIVTGRAPHAPDEVALGTGTMRALHKHIGDVVRAVSATGRRDYRIVGSAVFPTLSNDQPFADAAMFTRPGFGPLLDPNNDSSYLVGRLTAGADAAQVARRVRAVPRFIETESLFAPESAVLRPSPPVEVKRLREIAWYPFIVAALIATLAILAVGYTLSTSVRRRRRDLAVLKTIGFGRRQIGATIGWHATTVAAIGVVVGIPVGCYTGAFAWRLVAYGLGVSTRPTIPAFALVLLIPAAIAACNLTAFVPARAAARTRSATELRSQ